MLSKKLYRNFNFSTVISVNDGFAIISGLPNAGSGTVVEIIDNNTQKSVALGIIIRLSKNSLNTVSILGDYTLVSPAFWVKAVAKGLYVTITSKILGQVIDALGNQLSLSTKTKYKFEKKKIFSNLKTYQDFIEFSNILKINSLNFKLFFQKNIKYTDKLDWMVTSLDGFAFNLKWKLNFLLKDYYLKENKQSFNSQIFTKYIIQNNNFDQYWNSNGGRDWQWFYDGYRITSWPGSIEKKFKNNLLRKDNKSLLLKTLNIDPFKPFKSKFKPLNLTYNKNQQTKLKIQKLLIQKLLINFSIIEHIKWATKD